MISEKINILLDAALNGGIEKFNKIASGIDISDDNYIFIHMYGRRFSNIQFAKSDDEI